MANDPNFHFFHGRMGSYKTGVRASQLPDPYQNRQGLVPSLVVGPQLRPKSIDKPVRWAKVIPPGMEDQPIYKGDRDGGDKIVRGAILQIKDNLGQRAYLTSHRDDSSNYVLVRTGLKIVNGSSAADRMEIQKTSKLVSHGSYSFDQGSLKVAAADNEALLDAAFADANIGIGRVAAERIGSKVIGKSIPLLGFPQSSYVLWKMPFGAVLLIREVDGRLVRLISHQTGIRQVDAPNYNTFFEQLEEGHRENMAAEREKRNAEKAARQAAAAAEAAPAAT